jgi:S-adenosylmethionine:tRNA ribosyltransferase-isomerase
LLLVERPDLGLDYWETLVRPGRRLREGSRIVFGNDGGDEMQREGFLQAEVLERTEAGGRIVRFTIGNTASLTQGQGTRAGINPAPTICFIRRGGVYPRPRMERGEGNHNVTVRELIERLGRMPLPPYIHETLHDPERYQTVYARISGSAAAPTAGLHFTPHLLVQLREQGVRVGFVTLHVGLDTFRPIECEDIREHKMHSEEIDLDAPTAELINETRRAGGRVIAVGTTAVRVLESVASFHEGRIEPYHGATRLFITPGYRFQVVDAMITNFHLPRSTLLLLVSAFASKALIEEAYREAMRERYRFYSFGDAMLIL